MVKGDTTILSNASLRSDAPELRTAEQIIKKNEEIFDALERNAITAKMGEQMNQCLKTPMSLAKLEMQFLSMVRGFGRKAPVPRNPLLRSAIGLKPELSPSDGAQVRAMIPESTDDK